MSALELLSGDAQTFSAMVWASHVHLHQTEPEQLVRLLALADVDALLTGTAIRTPAVRVVKDGAVLPSTRFTRSATLAGAPLTGLVDGRKVLDLFADGATVVLQGLQRYWAPLTQLVRDLELELGHPCQANAYLTPPGAQGFARHSDAHDVFVFQTHGRKLWEVVEGAEPREVLLEPGVSMYLPTGTPHSARTQESASLHVTVGINRLSWRDALRRVSDDVLADPAFDAPLPAGYLADGGRFAEQLADRLSSYAEALRDVDAGSAADQRIAAFLTERTPTLRGGLLDLVALDALTDDTVLERRPTAACALRSDADRVVVLLGDRELRMPLRLADVMAFVRDASSFRVAELSPWLDPRSRLVVARRLVREGLLRIAG
ncbi:MAG: bifunctional lysine-specific demethylase and histidyl-hydroxylase [Nocardioidaceae bacterium]|nr:bifunctional lysine-specific demethylase and histidyl-hydroxylase [Nocardioidaceae bacterium]